jgi:hypothetical protein
MGMVIQQSSANSEFTQWDEHLAVAEQISKRDEGTASS